MGKSKYEIEIDGFIAKLDEIIKKEKEALKDLDLSKYSESKYQEYLKVTQAYSDLNYEFENYVNNNIKEFPLGIQEYAFKNSMSIFMSLMKSNGNLSNIVYTKFYSEFDRQDEKIKQYKEELENMKNSLEATKNSLDGTIEKAEDLEKDVKPMVESIKEAEFDSLKKMSMFFSIFTLIATNVTIIFKGSELKIYDFLSLVFIINSTIIFAVFSLFYMAIDKEKIKKEILIIPIVGMILGVIFFGISSFLKDESEVLKKEEKKEMKLEIENNLLKEMKTNSSIKKELKIYIEKCNTNGECSLSSVEENK